ncbi:unnamed protein product [Schistosoma curassoni]|uniref:Kinesin motor domain-containing protein n=1 Tax=Schistosoma curassoni TaxID=6186 RepID=A0A183KSD5_9TREM|nr:unnamed protein product [Schistosoma curassoni]
MKTCEQVDNSRERATCRCCIRVDPGDSVRINADSRWTLSDLPKSGLLRGVKNFPGRRNVVLYTSSAAER